MVYDDILRVMPSLVRSIELVVGRIKSTYYLLHTTHWRRRRLGFSLIELLIVISLFGLAASLITAAYLTFERSQKVKNTALTLKNDIRLIQNKAHTGDKGPEGKCYHLASSSSAVSLVGWYITIAEDATSYTLSINCKDTSGNYDCINTCTEKTVLLPDGIKINSISYDGIDPSFTSIHLLFQPLVRDAKFFNDTQFVPSTRPFVDSGGIYDTISNFTVADKFRIKILGTNGGSYFVDVGKSGEVNEQK